MQVIWIHKAGLQVDGVRENLLEMLDELCLGVYVGGGGGWLVVGLVWDCCQRF
jgi:hypothetical protein